MKGSVIALLVGAALIVVPAVTGIGMYVSAYNTGNVMENNILATYDNNEQILGQYGQKVQEAAQVPGMMTADLKDVIGGAMAGRYGDEGSGAVMQWIQEAYPGNVDPALYTQIQRIIEAGRNDFQAEQTKLVDQRRQYTTALGSLVQGTFLGMAGYPKIDLDDYKAITTTRARETFEAGVEAAPLQLR